METEQEVPQEIQLGQALLVHQEQEHLLVLVPEVQRRRQPARQLYQIVERLRLIPDGRRVAMECRIDLLVRLEQAQGRPVHPALDQGHRVSPERRLASQVGWGRVHLLRRRVERAQEVLYSRGPELGDLPSREPQAGTRARLEHQIETLARPEQVIETQVVLEPIIASQVQLVIAQESQARQGEVIGAPARQVLAM